MKFASRAKFSVDEIRRLVPLHSGQSREVSAEAEVALRS